MDAQGNNWDQRQRRGSGSSGWSNASSNPASINQRPRMPQDNYINTHQSPGQGMVHGNPFQNPSPAASIYDGLQPPNLPFSNGRPLSTGGLSVNSSQSNLGSASLSLTYLPSKFSRPLSPGVSYRKANKPGQPLFKRGGGRDAFASGAGRMAGDGDEDYDGLVSGTAKGRLRWNKFKWILILTNTLLTLYSISALVFALVVWFNVWGDAEVILIANRGELVASTVAAGTCILACLIGWAGILLNNRAFLAVYTLIVWVSFGLLVIPGYLTYRRRHFNLEGKVNAQWSRGFGVPSRLALQNNLNCCGYFNPYIEAVVSGRCYSRSMLPGCKGPYYKFQQRVLTSWYTMVFSIVPMHLAAMVAALLCSNHVTYRFGKGMTPKAYRLNQESMAMIMETLASNLAEQYNEEASRSNIGLVDRDGYNYQYPNTGNQSRDSSNSGHELSPGNGYGSYGSTSGFVGGRDEQQYPPGGGQYYGNNNRDRGRDKRL